MSRDQWTKKWTKVQTNEEKNNEKFIDESRSVFVWFFCVYSLIKISFHFIFYFSEEPYDKWMMNYNEFGFGNYLSCVWVSLYVHECGLFFVYACCIALHCMQQSKCSLFKSLRSTLILIGTFIIYIDKVVVTRWHYFLFALKHGSRSF